ncbi:MAG: hypothetical protein DRN60_04400 [Thaumarchaeota archaeon]|nr:MAG: hypothetical protein DRN60_04400 [Nitrososphaerota archaeon]
MEIYDGAWNKHGDLGESLGGGEDSYERGYGGSVPDSLVQHPTPAHNLAPQTSLTHSSLQGRVRSWA